MDNYVWIVEKDVYDASYIVGAYTTLEIAMAHYSQETWKEVGNCRDGTWWYNGLGGPNYLEITRVQLQS